MNNGHDAKPIPKEPRKYEKHEVDFSCNLINWTGESFFCTTHGRGHWPTEALPNPTTTGDNKTTDAKPDSIQEVAELRKKIAACHYSLPKEDIDKLLQLFEREKNKAVRSELEDVISVKSVDARWEPCGCAVHKKVFDKLEALDE